MELDGKFTLQVLPSAGFELFSEDGRRLLLSGQAALYVRQANGSLTAWMLGNQKGMQLEDGPLAVTSVFGLAQQRVFTGVFDGLDGGKLRHTLVVETYPDLPGAIFMQWSFTNIGRRAIHVDRLDAPALQLGEWAFQEQAPGRLWTLQGAAVGWGQDFAFPLLAGFSRQNYLGHLQDAEGGGIPVVDFWNKDMGIALLHCEPSPKDWSMPVSAGVTDVSSALQLHQPQSIPPGGSLRSLKTVLYIHSGDFFATLDFYREVLQKQGLQPPDPVPANFEPGWCSWGYEFDVRPSEITGVLPVLSDLGIRWLTLDDRWFDFYGDWYPRKDTFPGGANDMRRMNEEIHKAGGFSQIWWYPLCAEDAQGSWEERNHGSSALIQTHSDWVILNADGSVARNNRHLAMLCPALPEVRAHIAELTQRFIGDWGFDGHKLDNIYTVPACHNPAHRHLRSEELTEAMADAYRLILDITRQLRPNSVTQICPCGTPISMQLLTCTDQAVTADPTSSAQIRQRIKFYKALCGARSAVFADHVELSDGGVDFPSEIGPGGVPSTKFIFPDDPLVRERLQEIWDLPSEKQALWARWFNLYNTHRPSEGEYLNLYDLAYDFPEGHAIRKGERMYYAFFADSFQGKVELRGLQARNYCVIDYANDRKLGTINRQSPLLEISFKDSLLLFAEPLQEVEP